MGKGSSRWQDWARFVAVAMEEVSLTSLLGDEIDDETMIDVPSPGKLKTLSFADCKKQGVRAIAVKPNANDMAESLAIDCLNSLFFDYLVLKKMPYYGSFLYGRGTFFIEKSPGNDYLLDYIAEEKNRAIPYISKVFVAETDKGYNSLRFRRYVPLTSEFAERAADYLQVLDFDFEAAAGEIYRCLLPLNDHDAGVVRKVAAYQRGNRLCRFGIPKYVLLADNFIKIR